MIPLTRKGITRRPNIAMGAATRVCLALDTSTGYAGYFVSKLCATWFTALLKCCWPASLRFAASLARLRKRDPKQRALSGACRFECLDVGVSYLQIMSVIFTYDTQYLNYSSHYNVIVGITNSATNITSSHPLPCPPRAMDGRSY